MTAEDIARRWVESDKGLTPQREAKARRLARKASIPWDDVEAAVKALADAKISKTTEPPSIVH